MVGAEIEGISGIDIDGIDGMEGISIDWAKSGPAPASKKTAKETAVIFL